MQLSSWAKHHHVFREVPLQLVPFRQFGASLLVVVSCWRGGLKGSSGLLLLPLPSSVLQCFFHADLKLVQVALVLWVSACHISRAALLGVFPCLSRRRVVCCIRRPISVGAAQQAAVMYLSFIRVPSFLQHSAVFLNVCLWSAASH